MQPKPGGLSRGFLFKFPLPSGIPGRTPAGALQWRGRSEAEAAEASLWLLPPLPLLK